MFLHHYPFLKIHMYVAVTFGSDWTASLTYEMELFDHVTQVLDIMASLPQAVHKMTGVSITDKLAKSG
jgi:hypothetical protein